MSIKNKIAAFALAALAVTGAFASTTTQAEAKPFFHHHGFGLGAALFTAAVVGTAIAASNDGYRAAATFASSTPTATTSAAFAPAIDDNFPRLIVDPASGTGASSTPVPHLTRPVVPPGGSTF